MVVIRLRREGTKNRPFYRIVAADQRFQRDGRFLEILGTYDPMGKEAPISVNLERADYWLGVGAQPSVTVSSLIKRAKTGPKAPTKDKVKARAKNKAKAAAAAAAEAAKATA
jgi:small subunit ribosomal protein S16